MDSNEMAEVRILAKKMRAHVDSQMNPIFIHQKYANRVIP